MRLVMIAAICLGFAVQALAAERTGFDLGFARPGMSLPEFRSAFDNGDVKVMCQGEPEYFAASGATASTIDKRRLEAGMISCRHFKKNGDKFTPVLVIVGDVCCTDLYASFINSNNEQKLAQINARAELTQFMNILIAWSVEYGPASELDESHAIWARDGQTAIITHDHKATYIVVYDDFLKRDLDTKIWPSDRSR